MRRGGSLALAAALAATAALGGGPGGRDDPPGAGDGPAAASYLDGPPPGHTGGFGEPTCHRCHFDAPVGSGGGGLALNGLPERYEPGLGYRVVVELTAPEMRRGGFQLAVRCDSAERRGEQAGKLRPLDGRAEVVVGEGRRFAGDSSVQYARHTRTGAEPASRGTLRWAIRWTAPGEGGSASGCGPVLVHATANAANGDDSEFGDRVHTAKARVRPRR